MTPQELTDILNRIWAAAPEGEAMAKVHLFGIIYAGEIRGRGESVSKIVRQSRVPDAEHGSDQRIEGRSFLFEVEGGRQGTDLVTQPVRRVFARTADESIEPFLDPGSAEGTSHEPATDACFPDRRARLNSGRVRRETAGQ
ncbi:MAG: hypothetical protein OXC10_01635 [Rhodospirillaceae bacterium]|nr:hypothetical protein [Rhodospirillaceae bacterium]